MNTCENCIHGSHCSICDVMGDDYCCVGFKDEAKFIESPCKVGDTVWRIEDVWHLDDKATGAYHYEKEVVEFRVRSISISCNSKGVWTKKFRICQVKNGKTIDHQHDVYFCYFGKTVFPTKEEAEQVLAERSKEE